MFHSSESEESENWVWQSHSEARGGRSRPGSPEPKHSDLSEKRVHRNVDYAPRPSCFAEAGAAGFRRLKTPWHLRHKLPPGFPIRCRRSSAPNPDTPPDRARVTLILGEGAALHLPSAKVMGCFSQFEDGISVGHGSRRR